MNKSDNHINYSAADIEKYWKGELSAAQQHAMERAALDDPFLADAIDGYEEKAKAVVPVIVADNNELKKRLAERIAEKQSAPVIKFVWLKIAAALIVLLGASWLYTAVNNKSASESVAKNDALKKEIPAVSKPSADSIDIAADIAIHPDTLRDIAVNKSLKKAPQKNTAAETEEKPETQPAASPVAAASEPLAASRRADKMVETDSTKTVSSGLVKAEDAKKDGDKFIGTELSKKSKGIATDDYKADNNAVTGRANAFTNTFKGNVLDQSSQPVANAFIKIPNLHVATKTDRQGYFSFQAADTALSVSIASTGFETQNFNLRNNKGMLNQIILTPVQSNQREVVVQSNGAEQKKQELVNDISIKILDAAPANGWDEYNAYLKKNKKVSDENKNIHGIVIVSFDVHSKWLNNFKIEQSLDDDLDEEAIRLIKEGPAWKLLKGKKASATVTVKF